MKLSTSPMLLASVLLTVAAAAPLARASTLVINDDYTVVNTNSGFALGEGVNSGINPPDTRLTGSVAANLRYIRVAAKGETAYTIANNKINITKGSQSGRFTLSENGTNAFDFGPALGATSATAAEPSVYDVTISMNNKGTTGRMSFALGAVEGTAGNWNFGVQIVKSGTGYDVYKRIKTLASGLDAAINAAITNIGTAGNEISFLLHITDAGAETNTYNSRVQLSIDGGATWIYDTQGDTDLTNGWHFEVASRFFSFDQAANDGADTYDNFSVTLISGKTQPSLTVKLTGSDANISFQGTIDQQYILQSSQDLQTWVDVNTNTASGDGLVQFVEPISSNAVFYRTRTE